MTSDLNDKYKRLIAAGMPEVMRGDSSLVEVVKFGWNFVIETPYPPPTRGVKIDYIPVLAQHAEDLITMHAIRWAKPEEINWGQDGTCETILFSGKYGAGDTIIDAILDAKE